MKLRCLFRLHPWARFNDEGEEDPKGRFRECPDCLKVDHIVIHGYMGQGDEGSGSWVSEKSIMAGYERGDYYGEGVTLEQVRTSCQKAEAGE